jgi:hypothetical protein
VSPKFFVKVFAAARKILRGCSIRAAFSILLLAAGLLERDGAFIIAGHIGFFLSAAYFIFVGMAGKEGIQALMRWFTG